MNNLGILRSVLAMAAAAVVASTAFAKRTDGWTDHGLLTHVMRDGKAMCVMGKIDIKKRKNPECDHPENWVCLDFRALSDAEEKRLGEEVTNAFLGGKPVAVHLTGKCDRYQRARFDRVQVK